MAKTALGNKGIESAVRTMSIDESVVLLARSYDKLVRDLEYTLSHLSGENLLPELRRLLEEEERDD